MILALKLLAGAIIVTAALLYFADALFAVAIVVLIVKLAKMKEEDFYGDDD